VDGERDRNNPAFQLDEILELTEIERRARAEIVVAGNLTVAVDAHALAVRRLFERLYGALEARRAGAA
jgi:hypothetical protein